MTRWLYFLMDGDTIVYIGLCESLYYRLRDHIIDKEFTHVRAYKVDYRSGITIERFLIGVYRPKYNKMHNTKKQEVKIIDMGKFIKRSKKFKQTLIKLSDNGK